VGNQHLIRYLVLEPKRCRISYSHEALGAYASSPIHGFDIELQRTLAYRSLSEACRLASVVAYRCSFDEYTSSLLVELRAALDRADTGTGTTLLVVDGEEDLAALPAVLAAREGASVVYGQPDEGMVLATTTPERRAVVRDLLERLDGDTRRAFDILGVD